MKQITYLFSYYIEGNLLVLELAVILKFCEEEVFVGLDRLIADVPARGILCR